MRRPLFAVLAPLATLAALVAAAGWLTTSEGGLRAVARLAGEFSRGQLEIEGVSGTLAGPLAIERLRFQSPAREIVVDDLRLDWSPRALLRGELAISELAAGEFRIVPGEPQPRTPPPESLPLPLAVDAKKIEISRLVVGSAPVAADVAGRFVSDGETHRIDGLRARVGEVDVALDATLAADAPLNLDARAQLAGRLTDRPLAATLTAAGPLAGFQLDARARQGIEGSAKALVTPFADEPFASASVLLQNIDPAAWQAGAPSARIDASAEVVPHEGGVIGSFALNNRLPGRIDQQRLPLDSVAGQLTWAGGRLQLDPVFVQLPGKGRLTGSIVAGRDAGQKPQAKLALTADAVDVSRLHGALRPTRLSGPIAATIEGERQDFTVDLRDAAWHLAAEATRRGADIALKRAEIAAGDARVTAKGELSLAGERPFRVDGELVRLDPSRFANTPAALLNGNFTASGRLGGKRAVDARFALTDSRLAGQPLSGRGEVRIDERRLARADVQFAAGPNRLAAQGALGAPGDALEIVIDAPKLDGYGFTGGIGGRFSLAGEWAQLRAAGRLQADRFGWPRRFLLSGLALDASITPAPNAPLNLDLKLDALDLPEQPAIVQGLSLRVAGSQREHRLDLVATLPAESRLDVAAAGGFDTKAGWQGRLLEARLVSPEKGRNFRLTAAASLAVARDRWRFGPASFAGDGAPGASPAVSDTRGDMKPASGSVSRPSARRASPILDEAPRPALDWQATLEASAEAGRLSARLAARGGRIGRLEAELAAGMTSPWSLDRNAGWRGRIDGEMPDLGWLADLAGKDWQSGGRLSAHLTLAGTPNAPRTSGRLQGDQLALRLPVQGLTLADGQLDVTLADNLLHIERLTFASLLQPLPRPLRLAGGNELVQSFARPGRLEISGEMRIDRDNRESAALAIRLDRFGLFQTPDQWIALSGDGTLGWLQGTLTVRGEVAADAGYWQLAPAGMPQLSDDVVVRRADEGKPPPALRPKLDLELTAGLGRHFLFNGAGLSSRLAGSLKLTARDRDLPRAVGSIRVRDGRFEAYGQLLDIERGILTFNGLLNNPTLDIRAVRPGLTVEPGVQIGGQAKKPVVRLISDPELPDAEKLSWLVLGHGPEQLGAGDAATLLSAAGGLLGNNAGGVVQQLKKNFGLDEFGVRQGNLGDIGRQQGSRVAGSTVDTTAATGSQILSVGKQLTQTARLSYEQVLGRAENIVKLTVNLTRQISLVGRAGSDNAIDIFYTLAFGRPDPPAARERRRPQPAE